MNNTRNTDICQVRRLKKNINRPGCRGRNKQRGNWTAMDQCKHYKKQNCDHVFACVSKTVNSGHANKEIFIALPGQTNANHFMCICNFAFVKSVICSTDTFNLVNELSNAKSFTKEDKALVL